MNRTVPASHFIQIVIMTFAMLAARCTVHAQSPAIEGTWTRTGPDWSHRQASGADLRNSDLRGADLTMANLTKANLRGAKFDQANLDRVELDGADLTGATGFGTADVALGISPNSTNFTGADLRGAKLNGHYFENAIFDQADMRDSVLAGRCQGATFEGTDVRGMICLGAMISDTLRHELSDRGAIATKADFENAVKAGRDFSNLDLSNVDFRCANLRGIKMAGAFLHSAKLDGADLTGADLHGAMFYWASMNNTLLIDANLESAAIDSVEADAADFTGANLKNASLAGATFTRARFNMADMTQCNLTGSDLTGANFKDTNITGIIVESAIIEDLTGLEPSTIAQLHDTAGRWKYDLNIAFNEFVRDATFPIFFVLWPLTLVLLIVGLRRTAIQKSYAALLVVHCIAALPLLAFFTFGLLGGATTMQLAGSTSAWSAWVGFWPLMFLGTIVLICVALIAAMAHVISHLSRRPRNAWALALICPLLVTLTSVLAFFMVTLIAPTA